MAEVEWGAPGDDDPPPATLAVPVEPLAASTSSDSSRESTGDKCCVCMRRHASTRGRCTTCTEAVLCDGCAQQLRTRRTCVTCRQPWPVWDPIAVAVRAPALVAGPVPPAEGVCADEWTTTGTLGVLTVVACWVCMAVVFQHHMLLRQPMYHVAAIPPAPIVVIMGALLPLSFRQRCLSQLGCLLIHVAALLAAVWTTWAFLAALAIGLLANVVLLAVFTAAVRRARLPRAPIGAA